MKYFSNSQIIIKLKVFLISCIFFTFILSQQVFSQNESCLEEEICNWIKKVVAIKTPTMVASGILLSDDLIVTNKHVAEDSEKVLVRMPDKKIVAAIPIPNDHPADIIFLSLSEISQKVEFKTNEFQPKEVIMVAFDIGRNSIRIFEPSKTLSFPDKNNQQARIHSYTRNLPGTSGGALIDNKGNLIGIIASGGGQYNEAVPAILLKDIYELNNKKSKNFYERGKSIRLCADGLEEIKEHQQSPSNLLIKKIQNNCDVSNNKFMLDMAGQALGKVGFLNDAIYFLEKSTNLDPNSPTSLHSLAIALHLNKSYEREVPILKKLLEIIPEDPQVLRLAVQAAAFTKNKDFGDYAISLMKIHNPGAVSLAQDFLNNALN